MAKTPKLKAKTKSKSAHSRAARREVSPSVDVDKTLTSLPRAERTSTSVPAVLAAQHNSGISKKGKKPKSRAQRLRQEKGLERAEVVIDKREKKIVRSVRKITGVKARKATWDELNKRLSQPSDKGKEETKETHHLADSNGMETDAIHAAPEAPGSAGQDEQAAFELDEAIT